MDEDQNTPDQASIEDRLNELSKKFEEFAKRFAEPEPEPDHQEPDGDEPPAPPATDPADEPAPSDPKKTYSEDDLKKVAEFAVAGAVKSFAAKLGISNLGKPGTGGLQPAKEKHFEEFVAEVATSQFKGDQNAARAHVLTNLGKNEEWKKAYTATRQVKTA